MPPDRKRRWRGGHDDLHGNAASGERTMREQRGLVHCSHKPVSGPRDKGPKDYGKLGRRFVSKCRNRNATALGSGRLCTYPDVLDLRRMQQCLHDNTVLLGFLLESRQLLLRRLWCADIKIYSYVLKPDWDSF